MSREKDFDRDNELEEFFGDGASVKKDKNKNKKNKKWKKPVREHTKTSLDVRKNFVLWIMMAVFIFLFTLKKINDIIFT